MARNGSGTYSLPNDDLVNGETSDVSDYNETMDDIADALTASLTADGQKVWTGAQDAKGQKIILDADGDTSITADTDDQIDFEIGGSDVMVATAARLTHTGTFEPSGDTAAGDNAAFGYTATEGAIITGQGSTNDVTIKNDADQAVISIPTGTGSVNKPLTPAFLVTADAQTNVTGNGTDYTVLWANEIYDQNGGFASNTFTAPVAGRYLLTATVLIQGLTATTADSYRLTLVTSNREYRSTETNTNAIGTTMTITITAIADMDASDTATVKMLVSGDPTVVDIGGTYTTFSGCLLA